MAVVTPDQEQAAQMRTMVWLEGVQSQSYDLRAFDPVWIHPAEDLTVPSNYYAHTHRAIPVGVHIRARCGFDPTDRNTYHHVIQWATRWLR